MKILLRFDNGRITGELNDSEAAKEFRQMLPLTLNFEDYAKTEKIAYLTDRLSGQGVEGYQPKAGDITYYAPWGNLAFFYRDFGHSPGLVSLGALTGDLDQLKGLDGRAVTIESGE